MEKFDKFVFCYKLAKGGDGLPFYGNPQKNERKQSYFLTLSLSELLPRISGFLGGLR